MAGPSFDPQEQSSEETATITLTPDERAALRALLADAITDTVSNRKARLYQAILTQLSQPSRPTIAITHEGALAGAKVLAAALGIDFDGLGPGRVDPKYPAWIAGRHANARQGDYIDLSRAIIAAGLAVRAHSPQSQL
jgi:hypothetical protein